MKFSPILFLLFLAVSFQAHAADVKSWLNDSIHIGLMDSIKTKLIPMECRTPKGTLETYFPEEGGTYASVSRKYIYEGTRCKRTDLTFTNPYEMIVEADIAVTRTFARVDFYSEVTLPLDVLPSPAALALYLDDVAERTEKEVMPDYTRGYMISNGDSEQGAIVVPYRRQRRFGNIKLEYKTENRRMIIKITTNIEN